MATPQWVKKLGGHAGELCVAAEVSKRAIPNALLPENFSDDDILIGSRSENRLGWIQVKSCHPERARSFILRETNEAWENAPGNEYVAFVWLGSPRTNEPPRYWIARKAEVGLACKKHSAHGTPNWERRFGIPGVYPSRRPEDNLPSDWENRWDLFDQYRVGQ